MSTPGVAEPAQAGAPSADPASPGPDVFISYSRTDSVFVRRLADALVADGKDVWVDLEDIPPTAEWMAEIERGIDGSGAFAFVISPDSLSSPVCAAELDHAVRGGKRLLPLLLRDPAGVQVPDVLASRNWILFRDGAEFGRKVAETVRALEVDLDWVRVHTRLLVRASEWQAGARDTSLLLRGAELREAERALDAAAAEEPAPTQLQAEYVRASRHAATRRQRILLGSVVGVLVGALVLAGVAVLQWRTAVSNERTAKARELNAYATQQLSVDPEASILLAREAVDTRAQPETVGTLRAAIAASGVREVLDRDANVSMQLAAFSPDGRRAVTGGSDGAAHIWRLRPRKHIAVFHNPPADLYAMAFTRGRDRLLTLGNDGTLHVWQAETGKLLVTRKGPFERRLRPTVEAGDLGPLISTASFSGDGRSVAATTGSGQVAVWNFGSGGFAILPRARKGATSVAFAGRAGRLAVAYTDGSAVVWDPATGSQIAVLQAAGERSGLPALSANGAAAAAGFPDGTVHVWNVATRRELAVVRGFEGAVYTVALNGEGSRVVAAGADGTVRVWRVGKSDPIAVFRGHTDAVYSAVFDPTGRSVLSASNDGTTRVWAVPEQTGAVVLKPARQTYWNVAFSADGRVAASVNGAGILRVRRLGSARTTTLRLPPHRGSFEELVLSRDGRQFLAADGFGGLFLGDVATGRVAVSRTGSYAGSLDLDPSASSVAIETGGHLVIRDLTRRGAVVFQAGQLVSAAAFDPSGKRVVVGSEESGVSIYELGRKTPVVVLAAGGGRLSSVVRHVAFSPDGTRVAASDDAGVTRVWDVASRRIVAIFDPATTREVYDAAFSADGGVVATGDLNGVVRVWGVSTQQELARFDVGAPVRHVAFAADGRGVLVGSDDGAARLFACDACLPLPALRTLADSRVTRALTPRERDVYLHARPAGG